MIKQWGEYCDALEATHLTHNAFISIIDPLRLLEETSRREQDGRIPFFLSIKDLLDAKGFPTTYATRAYEKSPPSPSSDPLVAQLERAGGIVVGKTTTPEWGALPVTESELFGITPSIVHPTLSAGGSSGGAAVSVAIGAVACAIGSDAAGSIRIPAAWNGMVGWKPSPGKYPQRAKGISAETGFLTPGFITRSVDDLRRVVSRIGFHGRQVAKTYAHSGQITVANIRHVPWMEDALSPSQQQAILVLGAAARALGWHIEDVTFPDIPFPRVDVESVWKWCASPYDSHSSPATVEPYLASWWKDIDSMTTTERTGALGRLLLWSQETKAAFSRYDIICIPTTLGLPPPIGWCARFPDADVLFRQGLAVSPFAMLANFWKTCAIALPITVDHDRAVPPPSMSLLGAHATDAMVLKCAEDLVGTGCIATAETRYVDQALMDASFGCAMVPRENMR